MTSPFVSFALLVAVTAIATATVLMAPRPVVGFDGRARRCVWGERGECVLWGCSFYFHIFGHTPHARFMRGGCRVRPGVLAACHGFVRNPRGPVSPPEAVWRTMQPFFDAKFSGKPTAKSRCGLRAGGPGGAPSRAQPLFAVQRASIATLCLYGTAIPPVVAVVANEGPERGDT